MLKPATPLSILFLIAFVLLLLSTISTPVVKSISLASYKGYSFGVFGYCSSQHCSDANIQYQKLGKLFPAVPASRFCTH